MKSLDDHPNPRELTDQGTPIKFALTPEDAYLVGAIVGRWHSIAREYFRKTRGRDLSQGDTDPTQLMLDLANVHLNGRPLRLHAMLLADATDFAHDCAMIHKHVDRLNGGIALAVPLYFATVGERPSGPQPGIILPT
jgi:hypothetical protein